MIFLILEITKRIYEIYHTYLSNWEIKVFTKGMEKLGEYIIYNQIENFK